MNFEKIELYGFKSFADKTVIKFEEGITGIVGPNGCGKSNVADAIRWVLGEQSAKSLRGGTMQDVIFNGTQERKSLSYCEVSLFFNNKDKHLFNVEYEQVIITRKLFRSGESEYFINKEQCRLRDIIELLHQCGIGKNGYTVIGQGKVTQIMSAKPEDRRAVFEEAIGVAQNKSKKAESERRLLRVKEELTRYTDLIGEIENQLRPLAYQAKKTREYNALSEELKINEVNTYIYKRNSVDDEKRKITNRIEQCVSDIKRVTDEIDSVTKRNAKAFNDLSNADLKLDDAQARFTQVKVDMTARHGNLSTLQEKLNSISTQIDSVQHELERNDNYIAEYSKQLETNRATILKLSGLIQKLSKANESSMTTLAEIEGRIRAGDAQTDEIQQKVIASLANLSNINLSKGSLAGELSGLANRKQEVDEKLQALCVRRDALFGDKESCGKKLNDLDRKIYELKTAVSDKEDEIRALNTSTSEISNKIYTLNSNTTAHITRRNMLASIKERHEGYAFSVKKLLIAADEDRSLKNAFKGVVASLLRTDKEYEVAIETALGGALQNVVTATPEDAKFLIDYLKRTGGGRITFLPITSMKVRQDSPSLTAALKEKGVVGRAVDIARFDSEYKNVFNNLLGNTLIVDNNETGIFVSKKYSSAFKIVTLDGDVFSTQGSITGGSRNNDFKGFLANDRELDELDEKIKQCRAEMDELKKQKDNAFERLNGASDELSDLNDAYLSAKQEQGITNERMVAIENSLIELSREIEISQEAKIEVDQRIEKVTSEIEEISGGSDKLTTEKDTAFKEVELSKQLTENDKNEKEKILAQLSVNNLEITKAETEKEAKIMENQRLESEIIRCSKENDVCRLNVMALNAAKEDCQKQIDEIAFSDEEHQELQDILKEIEGIKASKQQLNKEIEELEERRTNLSNELQILTDRKSAEEIAFEQVEADVKYLEGKVAEDYLLDYEGALQYKIEEFDVVVASERLKELRERISALGAINGAAIEEHAALNERYQDMLIQKQDIEKASEDLKGGINELRNEILKTFDDGFKKINENFGKIFHELFGGGKASLELDYTDCEDPLEAGIEIHVQPPGKARQKISLLSGGEQSFTTIAILFAILKFNPMPFCVLDEIEAALDDANVGRFANYLSKFSKDTQFIVITHRKPTMERVDSIFGVTMEEKGVSKTVSIKLSEVEKYDVK